MTFEKRLAAAAAKIDQQLSALLTGSREAGPFIPDRLRAAMAHAVMSGGKRIRPVLVLETAAIFNPDVQAARPAALALELVHCYSLVHDDLPAMDNDETRRGQPTVWKAFDEWTAILAGDALLTLAFEQLAEAPAQGLSPQTRGKLVSALARASGGAGMVGGQVLDLKADKLGQPNRPDVDHIRRLQAMKTGRLFEFACFAGALSAGAEGAVLEALTRFGASLGAAFQLADDILDVEGDPATMGKAAAKDAAAGKATLIGRLGLAAARDELRQIESKALAQIAILDERADVLRQTLRFACARFK